MSEAGRERGRTDLWRDHAGVTEFRRRLASGAPAPGRSVNAGKRTRQRLRELASATVRWRGWQPRLVLAVAARSHRDDVASIARRPTSSGGAVLQMKRADSATSMSTPSG